MNKALTTTSLLSNEEDSVRRIVKTRHVYSFENLETNFEIKPINMTMTKSQDPDFSPGHTTGHILDGPLLSANDQKMSTVTESSPAPTPSPDSPPTEETTAPEPPPAGLLWRLGSGVVGTAAGAVTGVAGYGIGAVKWTASKGYDVGAAVVSKVPVPQMPSVRIPGMKKSKDKAD